LLILSGRSVVDYAAANHGQHRFDFFDLVRCDRQVIAVEHNQVGDTRIVGFLVLWAVLVTQSSRIQGLALNFAIQPIV
jgi:hypothetical protein